MAAIDTLTGITEVSHKFYEVTSVVDIGANIDDVVDSTFVMKDGGLLRWTNGCTTTFTRCVFVETGTAQALGFDNFNDTSDDFVNHQGQARFFSAIGNQFDVTPIFKGCVWHCNLGRRSDFDVQYAGSALKASPTFEKDEYGNYCKVTIERDPAYTNFAQFNHFASDTITVDGLIIDHKLSAAGAFEFARIPNDTDQMKDLIILDNDPGAPNRHTVLLGYNVPDGTSKTVKGFGARNIALFGGGFDYTLRLVDPVGLVRKADDSTSSQDGRLQGFRTFSGNFINATDQLDVNNARIIYHERLDSSNKFIDAKDANEYSVELQAYEETYDSVVLDTSMNDYREVFCGYGFLTQAKDLVVSTDTTDTGFYKRGAILLFENLNVSASQAEAASYETITDAQQIYDAFHYISVDRDDDAAYVGTSAVERVGPDLNFGDYDIVIDPTLDLPYAVFNNPAGQTHPAGASGTYTIDIEYSNSNTITVEREMLISELNASGPEGTGTTDWRLAQARFGDNGNKFYVSVFRTATDGANRYLQYTLSTPYDISTATYDGAGLANGQNGQENSFLFNPTGTRIYRISRWSNWYQADLTTAWDVTSLTASSWTIISQPGSRYASADFNGDGTKIFTIADSRGYWENKIYEFTLTTPYDLTTMNQTWQATDYNIGTSNGWDPSADNTLYHNQIQFIDNGNRMLLHNGATNILYFFNLDTPYTLPTDLSIDDAYKTSQVGSVSQESVSPIFEEGANKLLYIEPRQLNGDDRLEVRSQPMFAAKSYAGTAGTAYIKASSVGVINGIDTIRTTGTISLLNGASTGLQLVDSTGLQTTVTINGINPNTEVRMYRSSDDTEVAGIENSIGNTASLVYTFTTPEQYYIIIHNIQYTTAPRKIDFTTQSAPAILTVFQQLDRNYNNP